MDRQTYNYYKNELKKNKNKPFTFSNEELVSEFYEELAKEMPESKIYGGKYIVCNAKAEKELIKLIRVKEEELRKQLETLATLRGQIENEL